MHLVCGPQPFHEGERLFEPSDAVRYLQAERLKLFLLVAQTNAEDEPASGYLVERRDLFGHVHRVLERAFTDTFISEPGKPAEHWEDGPEETR